MDKSKFRRVLLAGIIFATCTSAKGATHASQVAIHSEVIESLFLSKSNGPSEDLDVFYRILRHLGKKTKIYPTGNYLYFDFFRNYARYRGNLHFDVERSGELQFTYYLDDSNPIPDPEEHYATLGRVEGVRVTKEGPCVNHVVFRGLKRTFLLNCYPNFKENLESPRSEVVIGPIFDESGIEFVLSYDYQNHIFVYSLATWTQPKDVFFKLGCCLIVGRRTGFVFLVDELWSRRILVAVKLRSVATNDYYDGPFDQLPDNWLKDDRLTRAIWDQSGTATDRYGNIVGKEGKRYFVGNYATYESLADLQSLYSCVEGAIPVDRNLCADARIRDHR